MHKVKIIGIGTFLPGTQINNKKISEKFCVKEEWIDVFIGNKYRHFSFDIESGKIVYSLSDICAIAAKKAIDMAQVKLEDIDAIIMATATPDNLMPATVNLVADQLGINYVATYALQSGCAGAIQAIDLGEQIIKSGKANNVLVIGGDVCNKFIDLNQDFSAMKPKEIINYILFGDGAGAILISKDSKRKGIYIDTVINILTGRNQSPGQLINWFGVRKTEEGFSTQAAIEDYKAIEKNVPILSRELMDDIFKLTGWIKDDISYFLPPQLSKIMTDKIIRYLDIPFEKTVNCVEKTGNNGNALPFIQLDSIWNTIKEGQKGIIVAIESSKWIKAGLAFHG